MAFTFTSLSHQESGSASNRVFDSCFYHSKFWYSNIEVYSFPGKVHKLLMELFCSYHILMEIFSHKHISKKRGENITWEWEKGKRQNSKNPRMWPVYTTFFFKSELNYMSGFLELWNKSFMYIYLFYRQLRKFHNILVLLISRSVLYVKKPFRFSYSLDYFPDFIKDLRG